MGEVKTPAGGKSVPGPDNMPPNAAKLDERQRAAFEKFKQLAQERKLYTPAETVDGKVQKASHDDTTILRYLRARQYDPPSALKQFEETEAWRKKVQIDAAYDTMDVEEFETARRVWTGRRDKRGIPLFVYVVSHLRTKELADYNKPVSQKSGPPKPKLMKLYAVYESLTQFVLPICSAIHPDKSVPCTSNIVDISNVGLWTFWNLKAHMQDASTLATAHYPETLDRIFIIGAPSFFSTVWGWIKKWFDPITVSKMYILAPNEVTPTLLKFIDIENIPKAYGGKLEWSYAEPPMLDDEVKAVLGDLGKPGGWQRGPIRFIDDPEGPRVEAVGSVDGKQRANVLVEVDVKKADVIAQEHAEKTADTVALPTSGTETAAATGSVTRSSAAAAPAVQESSSGEQALTNGVEKVAISSPAPATAAEDVNSETTTAPPVAKEVAPIQPDTTNASTVPAAALAPTEVDRLASDTVPLAQQKAPQDRQVEKEAQPSQEQGSEPVAAFEPEEKQASGVYKKSFEPEAGTATQVQA